MVRSDVAQKKISRAISWMNDAEKIFSQPKEQFLQDLKGRDLATFYLFLCIQECIDLAAHWVADSGWSPPDDAASSFDVLADRSVISRKIASGMRAATGLRNRIDHGYAMLDHERLHSESISGIENIKSFLDTTSKVLNS